MAMQEQKMSRRKILSMGGALVAGSVLGFGGCERRRSLAGRVDSARQPDAEPPKKAWPVKAIIDVHVHLVNTGLAGVPPAAAPDGTPFDGAAETMAKAFQAEMKSAAVEHALCMP